MPRTYNARQGWLQRQMASKHTNTAIHVGADKLRILLQSKETGTLEFKQEWYKIDGTDTRAAKHQKGELTKDILSLANGNAIVAGEEAYLIIGAGNELNADGTRDLFDVAQTNITNTRLLSIVNRYSDPPLEELFVDTLTMNGKRVIVITIPPSPHLHETIDKLETPSRPYDKYSVFVRHSEGISTASAKERDKILKLKQFAFSERTSAPPLSFGIAVGAVAGGIMGSTLSRQKPAVNKVPWPVTSLIGAGIGALYGGGIGYGYRTYYETRSKWLRTPPGQKAVIIGVSLSGAAGIGLFFKLINRVFLKNNKGSGIQPR
jgi:Putative DNA-binding domain